MLMPRSARRLIARAATLGALSALTSACGGLGPGDLVAYAVAIEESRPSSECYAGGEIPDSIKDDRTTLRDGAVFVLYVAGDEEALLDIGGAVLTGTIDGDDYAFSGSDTDVEYGSGALIYDSDHDGMEDSMDSFVDADMDNLDDNTTDDLVDVDNDGSDDRFGDTVDIDMDGQDDRYVDVPSDTKYTQTSRIVINMTVDGDTISGEAQRILSQECSGSQCPMDYAASCTVGTSFKGVEVEDPEVSIGGGADLDGPTPTP